MHPRAVAPLTLNGQVIENRIIFAVLGYMLLWGATQTALTFVMMATGLDFVSAFSTVVASVNNLGPALGDFGPASSYAALSDLQTWLLAIARFKALSALRGRKEAELDDEVAEAIEDDSDTPEAAMQKKDTSVILRKCIETLTPEHREIIDLVYYHEKSVEEVAEIVGIPENTVKTRMFYARKKLAESLKAAGIERGWP